MKITFLYMFPSPPDIYTRFGQGLLIDLDLSQDPTRFCFLYMQKHVHVNGQFFYVIELQKNKSYTEQVTCNHSSQKNTRRYIRQVTSTPSQEHPLHRHFIQHQAVDPIRGRRFVRDVVWFDHFDSDDGSWQRIPAFYYVNLASVTRPDKRPTR